MESFQKGSNGGPRLFVLSLKAGGTGLNLTAANHVFHFDRWWNPAHLKPGHGPHVSHRTTRNVQIHKFVRGYAGREDRRND